MYVLRKRFAQGDAEVLDSRPYKHPVTVLTSTTVAEIRAGEVVLQDKDFARTTLEVDDVVTCHVRPDDVAVPRAPGGRRPGHQRRRLGPAAEPLPGGQGGLGLRPRGRRAPAVQPEPRDPQRAADRRPRPADPRGGAGLSAGQMRPRASSMAAATAQRGRRRCRHDASAVAVAAPPVPGSRGPPAAVTPSGGRVGGHPGVRADPVRGVRDARRRARLPAGLPDGRGRDRLHARPGHQPGLPRRRRRARWPDRREHVPRRALDDLRDRAGQRRSGRAGRRGSGGCSWRRCSNARPSAGPPASGSSRSATTTGR